MPTTVLIDSREKKPLVFPETGWRTRTSKLDSCDYTTVGLQDVLGVERKSVDDLFATLTLTKNKRRFQNQLRRARDRFKHFILFVQGTPHDVLTYGGRSLGRANPHLIYRMLHEWSLKYDFVVQFADQDPAVAGYLLTLVFDAYKAAA